MDGGIFVEFGFWGFSDASERETLWHAGRVAKLWVINHDRRASEDAVFALRELTRRVNAKKLNQ